MTVIRSVWIWFATSALILIWLPLLCIVRLLERDPRKVATARWFRRLGPVLAKVNPWRIHVSGVSNIQPGEVYVVVSNHQSLADIPLIAHVRMDTKWLGKAELFRIPIIGWMMSMAGDIPVERGDRRKAAQALLQCARCLRDRVSVVFFPEGTRSRTGEVLPFNDGPFQLAIREQTPVLPIVVEGSGAALPRDGWTFGGTQDIYLSVLPPAPSTGFNVKQSAEFRDAIRQQIVDEVARLRAGHRTATVTPA
ncbi:MAG: 1-acyl-sn-glycerol-3-phosphate acyltransferase [Acidobacteria bacterium]|nr:1-acyl-sn-glycerol-3-phosphate acyltransferase [Acidobacteriota bacterium]